MLVSAPHGGRPSWGLVALIGLLVLAIGGLAGYFGGRASKSSSTNLAVVTPYASGSTVQARVTYDGSVCAYSGPTELKDGSTAVVAFVPTGRSALVVAPVADGTTWEQYVGTTAGPNQGVPAWVNQDLVHNQVGRGTLSMPMSTGVYMVGCARPNGSVDPATMIRVIGS